jgi:hypothetical protein
VKRKWAAYPSKSREGADDPERAARKELRMGVTMRLR